MKKRTTSGACAVVRNPSPDDSRSRPSPRKNRSAVGVSKIRPKSNFKLAQENRRQSSWKTPARGVSTLRFRCRDTPRGCLPGTPGEMWHSLMPRLWVNAPYLRCLCHTCNGKHIGGKAQIAGKLIGLFRNRLKGPIHDDLQLLGDLFHTPEEALQVLHPFKVADGDTTGIGQDIRNDHDALFKENPVGIRRSWAIRRF